MKKTVFAGILLVLITISTSAASGPEIKKYTTFKHFSAGKAKGVAIRHDGSLTLAPRYAAMMEAGTPQLWKLVKTGNVFFAGGGDPAAVIRFKGADSSHIYSGKEAAVFALTADQAGGIWFAPSPGGDVYRFENGNLEKIVTLETTYVWDLLSLDGVVLAATGEPGLILKLSRNGTVDTLFNSDEAHIRTLTKDGNGNVYAGSAENGIIYKFDASGAPSVFYDSPQTEIFAIIPGENGVIWAAGAKEGRRRPILPPAKPPASSAEKRSSNSSDTASGAREGALPAVLSRRAGNNGAIYKITPPGVAKDMWPGDADRVQSFLRKPDGKFIVGTGDEGRIYELDSNGRVSLLLDMDVSQITQLVSFDGAIYGAAANPGSGFKIEQRLMKSGEYVSRVFDAKIQARWGSLSWVQNGGKIVFHTRSGNSSEPDGTWSAWKALSQQPSGAPVQAPASRFLQWKAELRLDGAKAPELSEVRFGYMQANVAPGIESVTIHEFGASFPDAVASGVRRELWNHRFAGSGGNNGRAAAKGKKVTQQGFQSIGWSAADPNGDALVYDVFYKRKNSSAWRPLVLEYKSSVYSWDSRTMEDGEYVIKVIASDAPSNQPDAALNAEKVSDVFQIDNSPPDISALKAAPGPSTNITFSASDKASRLKEAWYALDAGSWAILHPDDGILDAFFETFTVTFKNLASGVHTLTVKVFDENENVRFAHLNFQK